MYLKLSIPGMFALLVEHSNFEIGSFAAASLGENDLAVISIIQQIMVVAYTVMKFFFVP
jgi:Na+-driven multidrug efflux pump